MPLSENTVVWASAGTGKTRNLVDTWVQLVEDGADPLRIVAITFTEKAAAEMRVRIRQAILDGLSNRDPAAHSQWTRVLGLLPAAPISTIHGFCGLLLREHGLHAGIDPGFSIVDEQRSLDLAREAAVDTLRDEIRSGNEKAARLFGDFGLQELVDILVRTGYWLNSLGKDSAWLCERASAQMEAARELRASVAEHLDRLGTDFERIGLFADEQEAKRAKHPFKQRKEPNAPLPRIGQIAGAAVAMNLSELVQIFIERFRSSRRSAGAMDFDDLLLETRNLLRDSPQVRLRCQEHYQALLVDEFQDTDEVQAEIVRLLCLDPSNETRLAQGKLMIVGDPKQSIYRFRRARVTVFVRTMQEIRAEGGGLLHLQENYRSAPPLAEFSNRLSLRMMDGLGDKEVPADVDTSYRIRFSEADILVPRAEREFLGVTYIAADPESKAATGRRMEARAIARLLNGYRSAGIISSWRETAILTRTMTHIDIYIDELEAHGIPVHVIDGPSFYKKTEVSDLIALLEYVLHPEDPVARAIVRSSSLAGVTFRGLLEGQSPQEFDAIVLPWIEKRDRATAAEILEDVVRRTHFDVIMAAQKNGRQRAANIGKLIEITRTLARQGTTALDDVVRQLRARANDMSVREPEAQTTGEGEDVVQLMTVHRAKGLEFDCVIVPDLMARTGGTQSSSTMLSDRWGLLAGQAYGLHGNTLPHSLILEGKAEDADQQFEEEKRLLYVAVTRARKMLVLGAGYSGKAPGGWRRWVEDLLEEAQPGAVDRAREGKASRARIRSRGQNFSVEIVSAATLARPEQLALNIGIDEMRRDAMHREFLGINSALSGGDRLKSVPRAGALELTPSDLAAMSGCFRRFQLTRVIGELEPRRSLGSASGAMRMGSLAHEILETGEELSLQDLEQLGVPELKDVFESREWRELEGLAPEREVPFLLHVKAAERDCFIRGRMDLVVPGTSPRVVDYKYASLGPGDENTYEVQMAVYSLALMKSLGIDRVRGELWYLKPSLKVSQREYKRDEAERQVTALVTRYLQAMISAEWPKAERPFCDSVGCGFRGRCWDS